VELGLQQMWEPVTIKERPRSHYNSRMDHDQLFKKLLQTFFSEFIQLFFPEAHRSIDFKNLKFLSQDLFTDLTAGQRRSIDILAETRLKQEQTTILLHVETQAYRQRQFEERMFLYFCHLYEKYRRRILPIAVFSYDGIQEESDSFRITFPFKEILHFSYYKVELQKRDWRRYIRQDNPVAAALLSKMGYTRSERVEVKREFLRMLVRMQLDPVRMKLLTAFFETYLQLTPREEEKLKEEIRSLPQEEAAEIISLETSWERKGRLEGMRKGMEKGIQEGIRQGKMEMVHALSKEGMEISKIAKIANLTEKEIEEMLK
jgi:predicted transposase YdaD